MIFKDPEPTTGGMSSNNTPYAAIAGGVGGAVAIIALIIVCTILVALGMHRKRRENHIDNQAHHPTTTVHEQPPVPPYPEMKESSFMNSGITPSPHFSAQCNPSYGVSACNTAQTSHHNVYGPETAEQRKLAEQNEYYTDTIPVKEHASAQPPEYDTIRDYYEKPAYENLNSTQLRSSCVGYHTRDNGNPNYYKN